MTLTLRKYHLQAPSSAPVTSNPSGSFRVAHRRVNPQGQYTIISAVTTTGLPATFTPQTYGDSTALLRDEFLISEDNGTTWKIVPRTTTLTGTQTVNAFSSSWTTATLPSTLAPVASLDFGNFTSLSSPVVDLYVCNTGISDIRSLTFELLRSGVTFSDLFGRVEISLVGTGGLNIGNGNLLTSQASSVIYDSTSVGSNTIAVDLFPNTFAKIRLTLTNYPPSGFNTSSLSFSLNIVANKLSYGLANGESWERNTLWLSDEYGYKLPLLTVENNELYLERLAVNHGGVVRINPVRKPLFTTGLPAGTYFLTVNTDNLFILSSSVTSDRLKLASVTLGSGGQFLSHKLEIGVRNSGIVSSPTSVNVDPFRFITLNANGTVRACTGSDTPYGVSVRQPSNSTLNWVNSGLFLVELGGTVQAGDYITPDATGKAIASVTDTGFITLESGSSGSRVLGLYRGGSGGSVGDVVSYLEGLTGTNRLSYTALKDTPSVVSTFLNLNDTPDSYTGQASKLIRVNSGGTGLEFSDNPSYTFLSLSDTPSSYTGQASKLIRVNSGGTGLEFSDNPSYNFLSLTDTPNDYTGQASKLIRVNSGGTGLEFSEAQSSGNYVLQTADQPLTLSYSSQNDTNGIFYYLGTQGYTQAWTNPATANYVTSTLKNSAGFAAMDRNSTFGESLGNFHGTPYTLFSVDFLTANYFKANLVTLAVSFAVTTAQHNVKVQASHNGTDWVDVSGVFTIANPQTFYTVNLSSTEFYRHYRLFYTSMEGSSVAWDYLREVEFYGQVASTGSSYYTVSSSDKGKLITGNAPSVSVTIPTNHGFSLGDYVDFLQVSNGTMTLSRQVGSIFGNTSLTQGKMARLIYTNDWFLIPFN